MLVSKFMSYVAVVTSYMNKCSGTTYTKCTRVVYFNEVVCPILRH
jgi:hypothetical protein